MIKLYICCLVLIIGSVEVGPDIDMKFHQEVMEIVSYDSSKPEVAKQYNERFNQYIKFQTMSSNIKDPIVEAIELFEHTLDKKALVWFQEHKDKFVDVTTLKTMFLQRYNPCGKTKRDQLQSWNILTFDP